MRGFFEPGKKLTTQEIVKIALPSVVTFTVKDADANSIATGSGFVVGQNMLATNRHVIEGAVSVTANFQDGRSEVVQGILIGLDASIDLCVLVAKTGSAKPLQFADTNHLALGAPVVAIGSPEGFSGSVSTGIISAIRQMGSVKIIQTSAPISHGSSGGPLLDDQAAVLGVTSFMDSKGQNLNFAYAAYYLKQAIQGGGTFGYRTFDGKIIARSELLTQPQEPLRVSRRIHDLLQEAFTYIGVPYLITGTSRSGISSGAFVSKVFATQGIKLPVSPRDQAKIGNLVNWEDLSPGDRLSFDIGRKGRISHAGLYVGNGYFIHSSALLKKVDCEPLNKPYYVKSLVCARRSL